MIRKEPSNIMLNKRGIFVCFLNEKSLALINNTAKKAIAEVVL
jgi:hypothetical protein